MGLHAFGQAQLSSDPLADPLPGAVDETLRTRDCDVGGWANEAGAKVDRLLCRALLAHAADDLHQVEEGVRRPCVGETFNAFGVRASEYRQRMLGAFVGQIN